MMIIDTDHINSVIRRHEKIALHVSGGKDSVALLHLMRPWIHRMTVYWCNPGNPLPETVQYMQEIRDSVPRFKVVVGNQKKIIAQDGWPSDVVSQRYTTEGNRVFGQTPFKMQSRLSCCYRSFMLPLHQQMIDDGISLAIRGKRRSEEDKTGIESGYNADGYELLFPIMEWSEDDVHRYLDENHIKKHPSYGVSKSSFDCMDCTAWWKDGLPVYLNRAHPDAYRIVHDRLVKIRTAIDDALSECEV